MRAAPIRKFLIRKAAGRVWGLPLFKWKDIYLAERGSFVFMDIPSRGDIGSWMEYPVEPMASYFSA